MNVFVFQNCDFVNNLNFRAKIHFQQKQKCVKSRQEFIFLSKTNSVRYGTFAVVRPENSFMAEKPPQKIDAEIISQEKSLVLRQPNELQRE